MNGQSVVSKPLHVAMPHEEDRKGHIAVQSTQHVAGMPIQGQYVGQILQYSAGTGYLVPTVRYALPQRFLTPTQMTATPIWGQPGQQVLSTQQTGFQILPGGAQMIQARPMSQQQVRPGVNARVITGQPTTPAQKMGMSVLRLQPNLLRLKLVRYFAWFIYILIFTPLRCRPLFTLSYPLTSTTSQLGQHRWDS